MSNKRIILCDLDGTLANCSHRIHHILEKPKDGKSFFADCHGDLPIHHMVDFINAIDRNLFEVWITSGRSDEVIEETILWLNKFGINFDLLIMRKAGDYTDDSTLKVSWLENGTIPKDRVLLAIDDRDRVVKSWRNNGIPCLQVAEGDF